MSEAQWGAQGIVLARVGDTTCYCYAGVKATCSEIENGVIDIIHDYCKGGGKYGDEGSR